jgi:predicted secreted protein
MLNSPIDEPVDVFSAIDRANLWLIFRPLEGMKGALCSGGSATGVLVNSNHPFYLQRFTAAHELGHYRLGHPPTIDLDGDDDLGCALSWAELEAESFASQFLMPPRAVRRAIDNTQPSSPLDAYQAALRLQVSYAAMVSRLHVLKLISCSQAKEWRAIPPRQIKQSLTHGITGPLGQNNAWLVQGESTETHLRPAIGDEVHVFVQEQSAAGYAWRADASFDAPAREIASDSHFVEGHYGGPAERHIAYEIVEPGSGRLTLSHSRGWEEDSVIGRLDILLNVERSVAADDGRGLMHTQLDLLAARGR